ncbi:ribosome silencing factor [Alloscardovia macacae]|uniref:Ribosomal silencing factor RsfS n=1 Tax=Alloscardovia macacae TaxID=1160091 RepID=A0A261F3S9_9BIFI|nr:ribosome silencing factor [Alloscardovia macacae]OZG53576.1 ribosome silencing factor RsfS [Alloscardovia macacae]
MAAFDESIQMARTAALAADEMKGEDIVAFDVSEPLGLTDMFLIATGSSPRHVLSIAEEVEKQLYLKHGLNPREREGLEEGQWVLLDFGDIVVHIMDQDSRDFYDLERLWKDCPRTDLQLPERGESEGVSEEDGADADEFEDAEGDGADDAEFEDAE